MSSIAGHAATGVAAYLCCNRWKDPRSRWAVVPLVFLAVCPDLDYLAVWLVSYNATPRFTHSLAFGLAAALLVRLIARRRKAAQLPAAWLMVASVSHPLMDLLVGAHPVPLLWPLAADVSIPAGVLPSAGALAPDNVFLWRNMLIELGILLPVFALAVAVSRRTAFARVAAWTTGILPVWAAFVVWSVTLTR
jgi:inner membrane protein